MTHSVPIFRGQVNAKGLAVFDDLVQVRDYLRGLIGQRIEATFRKETHRRSNQQNRWYRGVIVPRIAAFLRDSTGNPVTSPQAHEFLKRVFLGVIPSKFGDIPRTTRTLTTDEFSDYCSRIQAYATIEWKLTIPNPGECEEDTAEYLEEMD